MSMPLLANVVNAHARKMFVAMTEFGIGVHPVKFETRKEKKIPVLWQAAFDGYAEQAIRPELAIEALLLILTDKGIVKK